MGRYSGRSSRLILMCVVSLALFAAEISVAYVGNSLSLASDAFAVLSHFISMIIGLVGVRVSHIRWHKTSTYGFSRADVLGAFGNSVFAAALMLSVFIEAIKRYLSPQKTEKALLVLIVGLTGLFLNALNYVIFMECCYCRAPQGDTETALVSTLQILILVQIFLSGKSKPDFLSWAPQPATRVFCRFRSSASHTENFGAKTESN